MELYGTVLDNEVAVGLVDVIDVVGLVHHAEGCGATGAVACCAEVLTFVVLDSQLAIFLPETPNVVGVEGFVGEAQALGLAVVVDGFILAVVVGSCAEDVVPMLVALLADQGALYFVFFNLHNEVRQHHAVAVGAGQCEAYG